MAFFELLSPRTRDRLEKVAEERRVPAGERFIRAGERGGDIFRVASGSLEVVDTSSHPEVVLDVLGAGAVVGEMGFITGAPRSADVRAFEDAVLLCWRRDALAARLDAEPELAADFYRAVAQVNADRLRSLNRFAVRGGLGPGTASDDEVAGARELAEAAKSQLLRLDGPLRAGEGWARDRLREVLDTLLSGGERLFGGLDDPGRASAGALLARELTPYLVRSRLGELLLSAGRGVRSGGSEALAHLEAGVGQGSDALGRQIDAWLLRLPTAAALGELPRRLAARVGHVEQPPSRLGILGAGSGSLVGGLAALLPGGEVVCLDGDRSALARVDTASAIRAPSLRLRLIQEDLAGVVLGEGRLFLEGQQVLLLNGLSAYLPDRALITAVGCALQALEPGGELVVDALAPSRDAFLFDFVLGWPTLRRTAAELVGLLGEAGVSDAVLDERVGVAFVVAGRRPVSRPSLAPPHPGP